jgi:hypothetical protein
VGEGAMSKHARPKEECSSHIKEAGQMINSDFQFCTLKPSALGSRKYFCTKSNNLKLSSLSLCFTKGKCGKCPQKPPICPLGTKPLVVSILSTLVKESPDPRESKLENES